MERHIQKIVYISLTAALYVAVCLVLAPISFGPIQFRFSEILCLLSIDYLWAYLGVSLGCFISNTFFGNLGIIDMIFGTLATMIGCGLAYFFRKKLTWSYPLVSVSMIIIANALIVGTELGFILDSRELIPLYILQVGFGETVVLLIGLPAYKRIKTVIENRISHQID